MRSRSQKRMGPLIKNTHMIKRFVLRVYEYRLDYLVILILGYYLRNEFRHFSGIKNFLSKKKSWI